MWQPQDLDKNLLAEEQDLAEHSPGVPLIDSALSKVLRTCRWVHFTFKSVAGSCKPYKSTGPVSSLAWTVRFLLGCNLMAALVYTHVLHTDCLREELHRCWNPARALKVDVVMGMVKSRLGTPVAVLAMYPIGHASMARADVQAAVAAVQLAVPAIVASRTNFCAARDKVGALSCSA